MSNDIPFPTIKEDSEDNKSTTTFTAFPLSNSSFLANRPSSSKRRPTAFYGSPNPRAPPQPFSKSAAKRESVMALGSIQHLQHLYAKKGLASKSRPSNVRDASELVLALGPSAADEGKLEPPSLVQLPPSPDPPVLETKDKIKENTPSVAPQTDPELLRPSVERDLNLVKQLWDFDNTDHSNYSVDVLQILKSTTSIIRSVQQYVMALPLDDVAASTSSSNQSHIGHRRLPTLRSISYNISTASRQFRPPKPRKTRASLGSTNEGELPDPLVLIRNSALEVLSALQDIEERCRLESGSPSSPINDNNINADNFFFSINDQSQLETLETAEYHSHSNSVVPIPTIEEPTSEDPSSPSVNTNLTGNTIGTTSIATHYTGSGKPVAVWHDYELPDINTLTNAEEANERPARERWENRLLTSNGYLYKSDLSVKTDFEKERKVVANYLSLVDKILQGPSNNQSSSKPRPRHSSPTHYSSTSSDTDKHIDDSFSELGISETSGNDNVDDESSLPEWAQKNTFANDPISRFHALIISYLPSSLIEAVPPPTDHKSFMERLSDGQILCIVFNSVLRRSRRPWGFIQPQDIHDIIGLEKEEELNGISEKSKSKSKTSWTFRRTDNLRIWAAALKLRYLISLSPSILPTLPQILTNQPPSIDNEKSGMPSPLVASFLGTSKSSFNTKAVAQKLDGWEMSLAYAAGRYLDAVVHEYRLQQGYIN